MVHIRQGARVGFCLSVIVGIAMTFSIAQADDERGLREHVRDQFEARTGHAPSERPNLEERVEEKIRTIQGDACDDIDRAFAERGVGARKPSFCEDEEPAPEAPTLTFAADPDTIEAGETSTLSWEAENADQCEAEGGWAGDKGTSGSEDVTPAETTEYTLTCTGEGGEVSETVTVTVQDEPTPEAPTLSFTANPEMIDEGATATLAWDADNAEACEASDGWLGERPVDGSEVVSPSMTTTYTLTCTGAGGTTTQSVTVTVVEDGDGGPAPFTVYDVVVDDTRLATLEAAVNAAELDDELDDESATLTLFAPTNGAFEALPDGVLDALLADPTGDLVDVLLYHVVGDELDAGDVVATTTLTMLNGATTTIMANGAVFINDAQIIETDIMTDNGIVHVIDAVLVPPGFTPPDPGAPTLDFSANPETIEEGATSTLSWSAMNADSCMASDTGAFDGVVATSGEAVVSPATTTTYTLACTSAGGTTTQSVTVTVEAEPAPEEPTLAFAAVPEIIEEGATSTLGWTTEHAENCVAAAGWAGPRATSGMETVMPSATTTYVLTCFGPGGTTSESVTVSVVPADDGEAPIEGVVLSEVLYDPSDTQGGGSHEWVEIYNGSGGPVNLSGWDIGDADSFDELPDIGDLPDDSFMLIVTASTTENFWDFGGAALVVNLESPIGSSLNNGGDAVILRNGDDVVVDAMSYGGNTDVFDPPVPDTAQGNSLARVPETLDTDTADDWEGVDEPTPGEGPEEDEVVPATTLVISEVFANVDDAHGAEGDNEWVELYNPTDSAIDIMGWTLGSSTDSADVLATTSFPVAAGEFVIVMAASTTADFWGGFAEADHQIALESRITSSGLANGGDALALFDTSESVVDAVSYGDNTGYLDPAPADAGDGESLSRDPRDNDTDTAADWIVEASPNPGS